MHIIRTLGLTGNSEENTGDTEENTGSTKKNTGNNNGKNNSSKLIFAYVHTCDAICKSTIKVWYTGYGFSAKSRKILTHHT